MGREVLIILFPKFPSQLNAACYPHPVMMMMMMMGWVLLHHGIRFFARVSDQLPTLQFLSVSRFPIKRKLDSHMLTHSEVYNSICDICGNKFKTKYTLKKHIQYYHTDKVRTDKEPEQCKICFKWLRGSKGVKAHMKNIHEDPGGEHRCKICNHISTTAKGLRVHEVFRHERERRHKCYLCDKAFKRPLDLRVSWETTPTTYILLSRGSSSSMTNWKLISPLSVCLFFYSGAKKRNTLPLTRANRCTNVPNAMPPLNQIQITIITSGVSTKSGPRRI